MERHVLELTFREETVYLTISYFLPHFEVYHIFTGPVSGGAFFSCEICTPDLMPCNMAVVTVVKSTW